MAEKTSTAAKATPRPKENFGSNQDVRWCPGCGDYAILAQMKKVLPDLGIPREKTVFVSGIGCASRFPYYINSYGLHTIHGRAPTVATGIRMANPDLSVWIITGDGDSLSIGGNHLLHICRRNLDVNIILFNNRIYGLTKGQYSPTSPVGKVTKTTPFGSLDTPFDPISLVLSAGASFVARSIDRDTKHLAAILRRAAGHKGTSFVEVYQNCNIFNDGAFIDLTEAATKDDHLVYLEDGQPLVFGKDRTKAILQRQLDISIGELENDAGLPENALVHRETDHSPLYPYLLAEMGRREDFPTPVGVIKVEERPTYEDMMSAQMAEVTQKFGKGELKKLLISADTWKVD